MKPIFLQEIWHVIFEIPLLSIQLIARYENTLFTGAVGVSVAALVVVSITVFVLRRRYREKSGGATIANDDSGDNSTAMKMALVNS